LSAAEPAGPTGARPLVILAAGKAAGAMTQVAEDHYADLRRPGLPALR